MSHGGIIIGTIIERLRACLSSNANRHKISLLVCPGEETGRDDDSTMDFARSEYCIQPFKVGSIECTQYASYPFYRIEASFGELERLEKTCQHFSGCGLNTLLLFPTTGSSEAAFELVSWCVREIPDFTVMTKREVVALVSSLRVVSPVEGLSVVFLEFYGTSGSIVWCEEHDELQRIKDYCRENGRPEIVHSW